MHDDIQTTPIVFDLETRGLPNAQEFLEPVVADRRLTDPVKRAWDIKAKEQARLEKLSLDWNVGAIAAIGWWTAEWGYAVTTCATELQEIVAISNFWDISKHRTIVGFNIKGFDLRYLIQRSRYLGLTYPQLDLGKYTRKGIVDLFMELTFNDGHFDTGNTCMRRTLNAFARRFGIPVTDTLKGSDMPALVASGDWDLVAAHCEADLRTTVQLAARLDVIDLPDDEPIGAVVEA